MDNNQKSKSCYDFNSDWNAPTSSGLNNSKSYAYGFNRSDSFHDFSEIKSTLNQVSQLAPIKEEYTETSISIIKISIVEFRLLVKKPNLFQRFFQSCDNIWNKSKRNLIKSKRRQ
jgi:hypothetical protein